LALVDFVQWMTRCRFGGLRRPAALATCPERSRRDAGASARRR